MNFRIPVNAPDREKRAVRRLYAESDGLHGVCDIGHAEWIKRHRIRDVFADDLLIARDLQNCLLCIASFASVTQFSVVMASKVIELIGGGQSASGQLSRGVSRLKQPRREVSQIAPPSLPFMIGPR